MDDHYWLASFPSKVFLQYVVKLDLIHMNEISVTVQEWGLSFNSIFVDV